MYQKLCSRAKFSCRFALLNFLFVFDVLGAVPFFYSLRRENCIRALINVYLSERTLHGPTASFMLLSNCKKIIDLSESTFFLYLQYLYHFTLYQVYEFSLMLKSTNVIFTYNVFPVSMLFFHHIY